MRDLRHNANRDTMWIGKRVSWPLLAVLCVAAVVAIAMRLLG